MADKNPAKPFKWLGNKHGKVLWLDVEENGQVVRRVIGPNQIVKKAENLAALGETRQKYLEEKGALVILSVVDGVLNVDKHSQIDTSDDAFDANAEMVAESVATTEQMAKNADAKPKAAKAEKEASK